MERLLIKSFLGGENCPREAYIEEIKAWVDCDEDGTIKENLMQPSEKYMIYKQRVRDGQMGITPQFWMICMDLTEKQNHFHTAVQEGKLDERMCTWEFFLPFYFSTNKHNHARHGTWYIHQIRNRDPLHSGDEVTFSVQLQARHKIQTAVDQRGEQSLNKDAKTVGSIRRFSADSDAVTKWTMGKADQA